MFPSRLSCLGLLLAAMMGLQSYTVSPAQDLGRMEDTLVSLSSRFLDPQAGDDFKMSQEARFMEAMENILSDPASVHYPFSRLGHISIQSPADHSFRLFTWFVLTSSGYKPQGIIQVYLAKRKSCKVFPLEDKSDGMKSVSYKTLDPDEWVGCVYYAMAEFKQKDKKLYLLLGFNGNDGIIHKKIIDVLTIAANGTVRFGAPVFFNEQRMASRVVFQYSAKAKMSLNYDAKAKLIRFDHLSPVRPGLEEQYQHYVPDMSVDGFRLEKGKWMYKKDIDARNEGENEGNQGVHYNLHIPDSIKE
jgi:hypothetical protein